MDRIERGQRTLREASIDELRVPKGGLYIDDVKVTASAADLNEAAGIGGEPATVVAAAGTNQSNATALAVGANVVTGADGTKGVRLPVLAAGQKAKVVNSDAASVLKIYPSTGAAINALGANVAYGLGPGREVTVEAETATQLYAPLSPNGTSTVAEQNKLTGSGATVASGTQAVHQTVAAVTSAAAGAIAASSNDADGAKLANVQALQTAYNLAQADIVALRAAVAEIQAELIAFKIQAAS